MNHPFWGTPIYGHPQNGGILDDWNNNTGRSKDEDSLKKKVCLSESGGPLSINGLHINVQHWMISGVQIGI